MNKIIERFKERRLVILHDDFASPYRGVLVAAAEDMTPEHVNEAISLASGICLVALSSARVRDFLLTRMLRPQKGVSKQIENGAAMNMCVSVEAREGVTTGISAADRAATIRVLGEANPSPRKLVHPGHIFPVEVRDGGVLVKNSLPEGALDIVRIAGYSDAALFIDLLNDAGEFLSPEQQQQLSKKQSIPFLPLSQLVQFRLRQEPLVSRVADAKLPTFFGGELRSIIYKSLIGDGEHLALVKGTPDEQTPTVIRVQSETTFSDVFGGNAPPSRSQIHAALDLIKENESGVLVYLRKSSHGSLCEQISAADSEGQPKPAATMREYGLGAQILRDLGVRKAIILSNSATPIVGLDSFGIEVIEYRPLSTSVNRPAHVQ